MSWLQDAGTAALRGLDPETAHGLSLRALRARLAPRDGELGDPALAVTVSGLKLPNCVGLAAGYDKNAEAPDALLAMGFGFVECGTVTPLPQPGNARPRIFRLTEDRAVINRLGFNGEGLDAFGDRLARRRRRQGIVGANLGANKDAGDRIADYVTGLRRLWRLADYFTVNVSSPNTPGLRDLQSRAALEELAGRLAEARDALAQEGGACPLWLKVAPDLSDRDVVDIVETVRAHGMDGVIVANTTVTRPDTLRSTRRTETGGLSGAPLFAISTAMIKRFRAAGGPGLDIIGAGGVGSGADAYAKIVAGACAVQLYTALVYEGPGLVRRIKRDLARRLRAEGFSSVAEARGTAA